ncbi:hypothetical protein [Actinomycetospora cinnamomea]|uniref:hypothetical protein n=1 Tax=Actinomycetospora cinnamomea TaxID=663609 RepID=UPI00140357DD|nr:hypothetical protein [Actinomycetospora cinnamomea]
MALTKVARRAARESAESAPPLSEEQRERLRGLLLRRDRAADVPAPRARSA